MDQPAGTLGARFLFVAAAVVIVVAGIKAAAPLLVPFFIALFIAAVSLPVAHWLESRGVPKTLAVLVTILADVVVLIGVAALLGTSIKDFTSEAPRYQRILTQRAADLLQWVRDRGIEVPSDVFDSLINPERAMRWMTRTLLGTAAILSNLFLVFLTVVFILFEAAGFGDKIQAAFGERSGGVERFEIIKRQVQRYLGFKTAISLVTGITIWLAMWTLGIPFAALWGLLAFLLNYIPNLGSILAAIPPVSLAFIEFGLGLAVAVALIFLLVNLTLGNFLEPHLMGRRLGLSTLVVFLSLVFWGGVLGPVGMLLSVPLTMIVKIMLENTEDLRWVAVLLDANPGRQARDAQNPKDTPARTTQGSL